MNLPLISQLPEQFATALLLVLLVLAFVVAFKIMKMVFETLLATVLSAGFYVALTQVLGMSFSFNQMLSYAFLGASLYMLYTFLASVIFVGEKLFSIPLSILKLLVKPLGSLYSELSEKLKLWKMKREKKKDEEGSSSTKEVIVDSLED